MGYDAGRMRRRLSSVAVFAALCALGGATAGRAQAPGATGAPTWRVYSETLMLLDRWRGTRAVAVERTDVRQRLRLDAWALAATDAAADAPRLDLVVDLELGSDLGPPLAVVEAIPDGRRAVLDLYRAELRLVLGALDGRIGRVVLVDALGFDAVDGAAVELALLPYVTARAHGGLAVRRAWSTFGPELYEPDGTALRDDAGAVVGAGLRSRDLDRVDLDVTWRRHLDADDGLPVRDELGAAALARPWGPFDLHATAVYDLVFARASAVGAGAATRIGEAARVEGEWRRVHPTFAVDSIWSWFQTAAAHSGRLAASVRPGAWQLAADAELRRFDGGADAWIGGGRVDRGFSWWARPARLGIDGRVGTGYGGARRHLDVYGTLPVPVGAPNEPVALRFRLGAAHFDVADRDEYDGWAGWGLLAAGWQATPRMRLDGTVEAHGHRAEAFRVRALLRLVVEDLW